MREWKAALLVGGPVVVFAVAWATSGVRDGLGTANIALILAAITIAVASVSWVAGLLTSTVAALSLNLFHTEPVRTLRVDRPSDLVAVLLLGGIGAGVSAATAWRVRRATIRGRSAATHDDRARVRRDGPTARPLADVWHDTVTALAGQLGLVDASIEDVSDDLPVIGRRRYAEPDTDASVVLPESGAPVRFKDPRLTVQLVLRPRAGLGALTVDRHVVFAFADQLELTLTSST